MNQQVSKHITLAQIVYSSIAKRYGTSNIPDAKQYENCRLLCENIIEPVFEKFGRIGWSSFFRSTLLNARVGGSKTSDHQAIKGAAVDFDTDVEGNITNAELFHWLKFNVQFDQLIWEFGSSKEPAWIHISYRATGNRNQVLISKKNSDGQPYYETIK